MRRLVADLDRRQRPWLGGWYLLVPILALAFVREWWAPDEPRYGEIAKEAFDTHSFLVLHLCGELYPDKPPLVYWLAGIMGRLSGWSEFWMRVPSILATAGSAWMCMRIARRWLGEMEALWSVPLYLGSVMVLEIGGRLQLDPTLSLCVLAAIDQLSIEGRGRATQAGEMPLAGDVSRSSTATVRHTWLAGMWLGIGALAKGPVAWIFVGFALIVWRVLPKPLRFAPQRSARAWLGLAVLAILPVATWAALAIHEEPALLKPLLFGQHIGRITEANKHAGPVWNHLLSMPLLLLPWTLLCVAGLARAWRSWRAREDAGLVRIAAWFAVVFVFFSAIPPKRDLYLLPVYSAAAMLGACELAAALRARRLRGWIGWGTGIVLLVVGLTLALAPWVVPIVLDHAGTKLGEVGDDAREQAALVVPVGIAMLLGAAGALIGQRLGSPRAWANALALGMAASVTTAAIVIVPTIDEVKSARALADMLRARPERPSQIACAGVRPEGIRFYGGGPAAAESLVEALEREGDQFLGLAIDKELARLSQPDRARFTELARGRLGRHVVYVLGRAGR